MKDFNILYLCKKLLKEAKEYMKKWKNCVPASEDSSYQVIKKCQP